MKLSKLEYYSLYYWNTYDLQFMKNKVINYWEKLYFNSKNNDNWTF